MKIRPAEHKHDDGDQLEMDSMNSTSKNETLHCQINLGSRTLFLQIFIIIMGLPANLVALWIFCFRIKVWKPHTFFLFNLLLADFLLLISMPFRFHLYLQGDYWVLGRAWCSFNLFMLAVNRSASIAFMTVVALNRYFNVVHPHLWISRITLRQTYCLTGMIWIVLVAVRFPLLTTNLLYQNGNVSLCRSFNSYIVSPLAVKIHYVAFITEFLVPWFLLLYCSVRIGCYLHKRKMDRQKMVQRAIRSVRVISLLFTICFLPSVLTGVTGECIKHFNPNNCTSYNLITRMFVVCLDITYLNSALDPIIYCFSCTVFRDAFRSIICCEKRNVR